MLALCSSRLRVLVLLLGGALFAVSAACSESSGADDSDTSADDDDDSDDDDDDSAADDDDGPSNSMTIETADGGVIEVVFSGEGVECGDETCLDAEVSMTSFAFPGCCADEAESACGLDFTTLGVLVGLRMPGCEALNLPGSEDDSCDSSPPLEAAFDEVNGTVLPPCCQANGLCGFSASLSGIGFGCVSPTRFGYEEGGECDYEP